MADATIEELTAATTLNDDDLLVVQQGNFAKKLSGGILSKYIYSGINLVTPEMFGAKGDGVTDDTQAIIDAIEASSIITFKANAIYKVTSVATSALSNTIIYGNGATLKSSINASNYRVNGVLTNFVGLSGEETDFRNGRLEIYDLIIDGNADTFTNINTSNYCNGICLRNYETIIISGCYIKNTLNAGVKLIFCNDSTVVDTKFKDICLYNYPRNSFVGEGVVSIGHFYVNGSRSLSIYSDPLNSLVVEHCEFDNIYDSPALAYNCKYQCIRDCTMTRLHKRAYEANISTGEDKTLEGLAIFENNFIDKLNGPFVSIQGKMNNITNFRYIIRNNVVYNIRGLEDTVTQTSDVHGTTILIYNNSDTQSNIDVEIINNTIVYSEEPQFLPNPNVVVMIGNIRSFSCRNNKFKRVNMYGADNYSPMFFFSSYPNIKIDIQDNDISGGILPGIGVRSVPNQIICKNNVFDFTDGAPSGSDHRGFACLFKDGFYASTGWVEFSGNIVKNASWPQLVKVRTYPAIVIIKENYIPSGKLFLTELAVEAVPNPTVLIATGNIATELGMSDSIISDISTFVNEVNSYN